MTIPVQFRIDKELLEHIKTTARCRAKEENKDISWRDVLRQAIAEKFPIPAGRNKK